MRRSEGLGMLCLLRRNAAVRDLIPLQAGFHLSGGWDSKDGCKVGHQGMADLERGATVLTVLGSVFFRKFIQVSPPLVSQVVQANGIVKVEHSSDIGLLEFGR